MRAYTPKATVAYENLVITQCLASDGRQPEYKGPVSAIIIAYYPIPKNASKAKRELMLAGQIKPIVKPDLDNVAKIILDALNGIAYHDDNQVRSLRISKVYGLEPCVEVMISYEETT